ncbi:hypothetical protein HPB50_010201 [Hyalomma asiaticum]|uniref:Uncharacterized protein n=1 Tax=Hyalomma asiaticum TaxID=266040 RepID=A0ACB7SM99_HYAAI|nr:hypothetical protein HPB50_010201 [Hyalomma asiaticum]
MSCASHSSPNDAVFEAWVLSAEQIKMHSENIADLVFARHVAMRCFYGVIQWVYVNDPPRRCSRCRVQRPSFNFLDDTVPPCGPASSFVDVSTAC